MIGRRPAWSLSLDCTLGALVTRYAASEAVDSSPLGDCVEHERLGVFELVVLVELAGGLRSAGGAGGVWHFVSSGKK